MMTARLLCLFCVFRYVFTKSPPVIDCLVLNLEHVSCSWAKGGTPDVNYTFYSRFGSEKAESECPTYLSENSVITGCRRPYKSIDRFYTFYTILEHDGQRSFSNQSLKSRVLLNPPTNLTVTYGSDLNLWYYWNQTKRDCVKSQVRYRINHSNWTSHQVSRGRQNYSINLPSRSNLYELQVRSKLGDYCGESEFWSDWSEPVIWGSNNGTEAYQKMDSIPVWTPVLYIVGAIAFILLLMMLLQHERLRVILIPVVPKPSLIPNDIEDWFKISKGLKESFKTNYNEHACPVCEYFPVSRSNSTASSVSLNPTERHVSMSENEPLDASSSSASTASYKENK
ncbi:cytokine receptor common subunit gamma-like isoform X2 [Gouania willdenowi]|uniref:cytokine receptor common subunit gamma-like isoform X2 n=1 Tax=Gouania willdenowi TaxID=441366 RepID=UPI001055BAB1|nr:cytokine receptor common subunit gamma-like isoform X2 [Gouania willdenowi]